jgi:hypothetical protein
MQKREGWINNSHLSLQARLLFSIEEGPWWWRLGIVFVGGDIHWTVDGK